jgi:hypothetical protein
METVIVLSWLLISFVVGGLGSDREIGFGKALLISLLLSPLVGAIFVATSPKGSAANKLTPSTEKLIEIANQNYSSGKFEEALANYERVLTLQPKAPNTHFRLACIHSLKRNSTESFFHLSKAVEDGFADFQQILSARELSFLREQTEFPTFAQSGYKPMGPSKTTDDTISKLERLAKLKEQGVLTTKEFEDQKKKILAS